MKTKRLFAMMALLFAGQVHADADPEMMAKLKSLYPATTISKLSLSAIPGIYEVVMGKNVAYVDNTGRYFLFGHLYDMKEQKDLTADQISSVSKVNFSSLPLQDAIKSVVGKGSKVLVVFSDPECPYCKKLESVLSQLTDVTIYTFLLPLDMHPLARGKAVGVWCAADKTKAWNDLMQKQIASSGECDNPVERNIKLAAELGINGTPTIIFEDGQLVPGAMPLESLKTKLWGEK